MLTDFQNLFTDRFTSEYATKLSLGLIIPSHLKRVAALTCETSLPENYRKFDACIVIYDRSQGSVATGFRCGGLFSNCFTTDSLVSLLVKQFLKYVNTWRSYRHEVTNRPLIIMQKHFAAISFFLLRRSRCVLSYCENFSMATVCVF